jgi:hypothetical protein
MTFSAALAEAGGNKSQAARALGITRNALIWGLEKEGAENRPIQSPHHVRYLQTANDRPKDRPFPFPETRKPVTKPVTHCLIPDVQAKPGVPLEHLKWAGEYIAEKRPDVIVCIGDFADMRSLSRYNTRREEEGQRVVKDFSAVHQAMENLMTPIVRDPSYKPRLVMVPGNHEQQIDRFLEDNPKLIGLFGADTLGYEAWGWEVAEYLKPVIIDGVSYCHYFYNPNSGKPYSGSNLETRLNTIGHSFSMGHQQGLKIAIKDLTNGKRLRGLVAGSFYMHDEGYKGPQGNSHWQGIIMKHEVRDGNYDLLEVSLDYLRRRYGSP